MRIATWNINGVRARVETLERWLKEQAPDVVCLQEIKCQDDSFPIEVPDRLDVDLPTSPGGVQGPVFANGFE